MLWVHVVGSVFLLGNFFVFSQKWRSSIEKKDVKSGYNKPPDMKYKIFNHPSNFLATDYKPNIQFFDGFNFFFSSLSLFHFLAIENPQKIIYHFSFKLQFSLFG
jgi:hypothetical protein